MLKDTGFLITGSYKIIGCRVAADLAPDYSGRVVVAAWSAEEAAQLAVELGHGVRERKVEVGDYKTYWPGCVSNLPVSVRSCKHSPECVEGAYQEISLARGWLLSALAGSPKGADPAFG